MLFKVKEGGWKGQVGEFVRDEFDRVVLRMAAGRLVEFDPTHVEAHVEADPEADAKAEFSGSEAPGALGVSEPSK